MKVWQPELKAADSVKERRADSKIWLLTTVWQPSTTGSATSGAELKHRLHGWRGYAPTPFLCSQTYLAQQISTAAEDFPRRVGLLSARGASSRADANLRLVTDEGAELAEARLAPVWPPREAKLLLSERQFVTAELTDPR